MALKQRPRPKAVPTSQRHGFRSSVRTVKPKSNKIPILPWAILLLVVSGISGFIYSYFFAGDSNSSKVSELAKSKSQPQSGSGSIFNISTSSPSPASGTSITSYSYESSKTVTNSTTVIINAPASSSPNQSQTSNTNRQAPSKQMVSATSTSSQQLTVTQVSAQKIAKQVQSYRVSAQSIASKNINGASINAQSSASSCKVSVQIAANGDVTGYKLVKGSQCTSAMQAVSQTKKLPAPAKEVYSQVKTMVFYFKADSEYKTSITNLPTNPSLDKPRSWSQESPSKDTSNKNNDKFTVNTELPKTTPVEPGTVRTDLAADTKYANHTNGPVEIPALGPAPITSTNKSASASTSSNSNSAKANESSNSTNSNELKPMVFASAYVVEDVPNENSASQKEHALEISKYRKSVNTKILKNFSTNAKLQRETCRITFEIDPDGKLSHVWFVEGHPEVCEAGKKAITKTSKVDVPPKKIYNLVRSQTINFTPVN